MRQQLFSPFGNLHARSCQIDRCVEGDSGPSLLAWW
jgi:hypothetical protein